MALSARDYALDAPSLLDTSGFDLETRLPPEKLVDQRNYRRNDANVPDRFGLRWREQIRTVSGYELVTNKKVLAKVPTPAEQVMENGWNSGPA